MSLAVLHEDDVGMKIEHFRSELLGEKPDLLGREGQACRKIIQGIRNDLRPFGIEPGLYVGK